MSGWNKWGIKRKLFSIILLILVLNIVVLLVMGSTLFEKFYRANKITELKKSAQSIQNAYNENSETFYDEISQLENENTIVSLMRVENNGVAKELIMDYHSRSGKSGMRPWGDKEDMPRPKSEDIDRFQADMLDRFERTGDSPLIEESTHPERESPDGFITLSARLSEGFYLYIQTPRGYIRSVADLAVRYTAGLSICILAFGAVLIYLLVGRITRPISSIQEVAHKISRLDFSQRCEVSGGDEIAMLAGSINHMSTELEASVEKLVAANEVLQNDLVRQQQTDRMRRQFVANVSHDFKTPLTLMISYAEALSEQMREGEQREYCGIIIGEGNKLSAMVGKLLGLSKLENGIDRIERSIFCLGEVIDEAVKNHRILTEKRGITVRCEFEDAFIVNADYLKIEQVVTNLFENAVKYAAENSGITVRAEKRGQKCRVSVEDIGNPIAEEDLGSLFDSFYRADRARGSRDSFGLGLAIVRVVMEAHGEAYGVENTPGGVEFWFELPLADFGFDDEEEE